MRRIILPALGLFAAMPAMAHEDAGFFHFHPHGSEAVIAGVALTAAAGFLLWRFLRNRG